jgi:hypothetical protein
MTKKKLHYINANNNANKRMIKVFFKGTTKRYIYRIITKMTKKKIEKEKKFIAYITLIQKKLL